MSSVAGSRWSMAVFSLLVYTPKPLGFSKVPSMRLDEPLRVLCKCLQAKDLRHLIELLKPISAVSIDLSRVHHEERLSSPVVDVEHPRFRLLGDHHEQQGALRVIQPLLELPLRPPRKFQDQLVFIQPVQSQTPRVRVLHSQHFVDDKTTRGHCSSPSVFVCQWLTGTRFLRCDSTHFA